MEDGNYAKLAFFSVAWKQFNSVSLDIVRKLLMTRERDVVMISSGLHLISKLRHFYDFENIFNKFLSFKVFFAGIACVIKNV